MSRCRHRHWQGCCAAHRRCRCRCHRQWHWQGCCAAHRRCRFRCHHGSRCRQWHWQGCCLRCWPLPLAPVGSAMVVVFVAIAVLVLRPAHRQRCHLAGRRSTRRLIVYGKLRRWRLHRCNLDGYRPVPLGRVGSGMVVEPGAGASSVLVRCPARWQIRRWERHLVLLLWWHLDHCARSRAALDCLHLQLSRHLTSRTVARHEPCVEVRHPMVEAHCAHSTFLRHGCVE